MTETSNNQFWDEERLKKAILELDTIELTDEQRFVYEKVLCINALAIKNEEKKIEKAVAVIVEKFIERALAERLEPNLVAEIVGVSVEYVESFQK